MIFHYGVYMDNLVFAFFLYNAPFRRKKIKKRAERGSGLNDYFSRIFVCFFRLFYFKRASA